MKFSVRTEIYLAALGTVHSSFATLGTTGKLECNSQHRQDIADFSTAPISTGAPLTLQWVQKVLVPCGVNADTSEFYSGICRLECRPERRMFWQLLFWFSAMRPVTCL